MKVYLLPIAENRCVFYSEAPRRTRKGKGKGKGATPPCGSEGPAHWLRRQFQKARDGLLRSRRQAGPTMRKIWGFFERLHAPDEATLHRLRKSDRVEILYPVAMPKEEADTRWKEYIRQCHRRHVWRTTINVLICPFTLALAPIPGPNIIGYWFVYRAASNGLALWGTHRVRKGRVSVAFQHCPALDDLIAAESAQLLQDDSGRAKLRRFIWRSRPRNKPALRQEGSSWRMES